jgi:hypothetical protein
MEIKKRPEKRKKSPHRHSLRARPARGDLNLKDRFYTPMTLGDLSKTSSFRLPFLPFSEGLFLTNEVGCEGSSAAEIFRFMEASGTVDAWLLPSLANRIRMVQTLQRSGFCDLDLLRRFE